MANPSVTTQTLEAFSAAWNAHDIDALMSFMAPNCIFETVSGTNVFGNRFEGQEAVRTAFESAWKNFPDAQWLNGKHFVAGDRGVSEWLFVGTGLDGKRVEANGVDIFTFADGKILVKNAFRKMRT
jgi:ketosteroid isomerase-like protein